MTYEYKTADYQNIVEASVAIIENGFNGWKFSSVTKMPIPGLTYPNNLTLWVIYERPIKDTDGTIRTRKAKGV